jgi:hypothetical protein
MIKNAQKRRSDVAGNVKGKMSAVQLSGIQTQFLELDGKMSSLQATQQHLASEITSMQGHNTRQFDKIRANMISSLEVTNKMPQSKFDIRTRFSQKSTFMMDLAKKMDAELNRRGGVPLEVNAQSQSGQHRGSSEFSSVLGISETFHKQQHLKCQNHFRKYHQ